MVPDLNGVRDLASVDTGDIVEKQRLVLTRTLTIACVPLRQQPPAPPRATKPARYRAPACRDFFPQARQDPQSPAPSPALAAHRQGRRSLVRICDLLVVALKPDEHLYPLISALVNTLEDKPRIVANCCWALMNLSDHLGSFYEEESIVTALLRVTDGTDNDSNFLQNTALATLSHMEQLLGMQNQFLGIDERNNWNELQSNMQRFGCAYLLVIQNVVCKLGNGIEPLADQTMIVLLGLIQSSTVLEDAFLAVGTMAAALEVKFSPYIQAFLPFLYPALKVHEDTHLYVVAVVLLATSRGEQSVQYADLFISMQLENLSSEMLNCNMKIPILSCFSNIALAIGLVFEPYLDQSCRTPWLREGILEAYTGTVTGLKNTEKVQLLFPHIQLMLKLVKQFLADEERPESVRLSLGLVGDLADAFPNGEIKQLLLAEWLAQMLRAKIRLSSDTKKTLRWYCAKFVLCLAENQVRTNVGEAPGMRGTTERKQALVRLLDRPERTERHPVPALRQLSNDALAVNSTAFEDEDSKTGELGWADYGKTRASADVLLWINIIMDTFAVLALATDPVSLALLDRKPDKKTAPLFNMDMYKQTFGQSVY
ncbi:armadillo-type protein [Phellopilus nigrolimitatus]|nr:armadillo-type protein [Phellopilus nigrolimitatus]